MTTRTAHRATKLCFAIPAFVFLLFTALEIADSIGFEAALASAPISTSAQACAPLFRPAAL